MNEEYKTIEDFPDYEISNFGNVKSIKGSKNNLLKQEVIKRDHTNYRRVTLSKNGITQRFQVHRLVAIHFIENIENKPFVNHIDNNGENNNMRNLEWATSSENMIHAQKQGRLFEAQSYGGKIGGLVSKLKADESEKLLYGKQFGNWIVLGSVDNEDIIKKYRKVKCKCLLCDEIYNISTSSLKSGATTNCLSCGKSKNTIEKRIIEAKKYMNKEFNNWKVVNFDVVRSFDNKSRITTFIKCDCKNCMNSVTMKLEQIKKNIINQCIICNHKSKGEDIVLSA
jgi:hypothetical protein